jgi:hypothetical protein
METMRVIYRFKFMAERRGGLEELVGRRAPGDNSSWIEWKELFEITAPAVIYINSIFERASTVWYWEVKAFLEPSLQGREVSPPVA